MAGKRKSPRKEPARPDEGAGAAPERPARGPLRRVPAAALVVVLAILCFADVVFLRRGFYLEDLTLYHHPMKKMVRDAMRSGELPEWNPRLGAGQPMAANPAYEVFYPGQWPVLLFDYDRAFQLHIVLHLVLAALGMYLLARSSGLGGPAAILAGVAYGAGGPLVSLVKLLPFLFAMTWLPYIAMFARRFLITRSGRDFALASLFLGVQAIVSEPVTLLQTWALVALYAVYRGWTTEGGRVRQCARNLLSAGAMVATGIFVAAVQFLPALDHARDSVRARGFSWEVASNWSMPPQRLLEIAFPGLLRELFAGPSRSMMAALYGSDLPYVTSLYAGLAVIILALCGLTLRQRGWQWAALVLVVSVVVASGSHTPLFRLLYDSHLFSSIRYPEKFILGGLFVLVVWSAHGAERLFSLDRSMLRRAIALTVAWSAIALVAALLASPDLPQVPADKIRPGQLLVSPRVYWLENLARGAAMLAILYGLASRKRTALWSGALVAFTVAELVIERRQIAPTIGLDYFARPSVLSGIRTDGAPHRVYHRAETTWWHDAEPIAAAYSEDEPSVWWSFRNAAFPSIPAAWGTELVLHDDLDETILTPTAEFRDMFLRVHDEHRTDLEETMLSMSNVTAELVFRRPEEAIAEAAGDRSKAIPVRVVERGPAPRYYFATRIERARDSGEFLGRFLAGGWPEGVAFADVEPFAPAAGTVRHATQSWNRISLDVESQGRGLLVISVTPHKYWRATIDGRPAELRRVNIGYQGLEVPAGRHAIEMRYRNPLIPAGAGISLAALLALGTIAARPRNASASDQVRRRDVIPASSARRNLASRERLSLPSEMSIVRHLRDPSRRASRDTRDDISGSSIAPPAPEPSIHVG